MAPSFDSRRSDSRDPTSIAHKQPQSKVEGKEKVGTQTFMDRWVEPALAAPTASYEENGMGPYGVLEHMQPLGEVPSAKVKQRVRADGARKSVLGRSSAAAGQDVQSTPEGSPAPPPPSPQAANLTAPQPIILDDEKDDDYAPSKKKKERTSRARTVKRRSEPASSATPAPPSAGSTKKPKATGAQAHVPQFEYDADKLKRVVEAAKARARDVGKPDLAAAVNEIYEQSLLNSRLRLLLEAILTQNASASQNNEFQDYVKAAKKKLKDAKNKSRMQPPPNTNGTQEKLLQVTNSPATKLTLQSVPTIPPETSRPIPSTELLEPTKPKISLKVKSPAKDPNRRRSGNGKMSMSPRKRSGSAGSDSSLTSLTSNEDDGDMDLDDSTSMPPTAGSAKINGALPKDHAAERGSLAVPGGAVKRSSAEADLEEDERDRQLAVKKQRLGEGVNRDHDFEESSIRSAPKSRVQRVRDGALVPSALKLEANGSRAASIRGSRAPSMDVDSPLSDLSAANSRQTTPKLGRAAPKPALKRAKTKQSPEKRQLAALGTLSGPGGAGAESPVVDDDNEELGSENNDYCSACAGSGYLLCCDGCDRSFHFTCLDPPLNDEAKELDEPWYCFICVARKPVATESAEKPAHGLFSALLNGLKKQNPATFLLPADIREYFEGVQADRNGSFIEAVSGKPTRNKPGYSEDQPDYHRLRDGKGNLVLCYSCGKSSQQIGAPKRPIVTCDHCGQHWHLDCLDPPLANPPALNQNGKKAHDWMCPLHADQELRRVDTSRLNRRRIHVRRPKNATVMETSLRRGHQNNGIIEVLDDDTDASDSEFYEHEDNGVVFKLPEHGIKLDFIDKVKDSRIQQLRDQRAYKRLRRAKPIRRPLEQANFAKRPFNEKQVALQLAQFATDSTDLDLGADQLENLVGALIAEAPAEVVEEMMASETAAKAKSASSAAPPSPPASELTGELSAEQRKELEMLQELIRRKLESSKP